MMINTTINNYPLIEEIRQAPLACAAMSPERRESGLLKTSGNVTVRVTELSQDFDYSDMIIYFDESFSTLSLREQTGRTPYRCPFHLQAKRIYYLFGKILLRDDTEIRVFVRADVQRKTSFGWQKLHPEKNAMLSDLTQQKLSALFTNYIKILAYRNAHWLQETSPLDNQDFPCDDYGLIVVLNTQRFKFTEHWFKPENAGTWGGILTASCPSSNTFWDHFRAAVLNKMTQHISQDRNLATSFSYCPWDHTLIC